LCHIRPKDRHRRRLCLASRLSAKCPPPPIFRPRAFSLLSLRVNNTSRPYLPRSSSGRSPRGGIRGNVGPSSVLSALDVDRGGGPSARGHGKAKSTVSDWCMKTDARWPSRRLEERGTHHSGGLTTLRSLRRLSSACEGRAIDCFSVISADSRCPARHISKINARHCGSSCSAQMSLEGGHCPRSLPRSCVDPLNSLEV
jgi:hypothetical protein